MLKERKDMVIIGFMIFASFFGAGNLIFPPYLGVLTGSSWLIGFLGFLIGDVVLSILAIVGSSKFPEEPIGILTRGGEKFALVMGSILMICSCPLMVIPRTAATSFEISILPIFPNANSIIFSIVFFIISLILTIKPSKVVDYVGQFLTPALLLALIVLIIKGIISPLGPVRDSALIDNLFLTGLSQGYQTCDAIGGTCIAIVIMASINAKGYTDQNQKINLTIKSGIVAGICLTIIYGGLCYVGTTVSTQYGADIEQTALVVSITNALLGDAGKILMGIIVLLACLTTSIGTTAAVSQYFAAISNNKIKYEYVVVVVSIFSAIISNFGVSTILKVSLPVLSVIYPALVALIILTLFTNKIKNDNVYKLAAYMAIFIGILTQFNVSFVNQLPFASLGFNWVIPTIIAAVIGNFIKSKNNNKQELNTP